jgi:signal transduction histidine kinase
VVALYDRHNTLAVWARYCPENFRCRLLLVEAQIACVEGRCSVAEQRFEDAISEARQQGFFQIEAFAAEAAARHYARRSLHIVARSYLCHARQAYASLGASAKVHAIDSAAAQEPPLAPSPRERHLPDRPICRERSELQSARPDAPAGEIILSKLAGSIVTSSVEFAGAQRGVLALYQGAALQIVAEARLTRDGVTLSMCPSELSSHDVPMSIVQAAARSGSHIALNDALTDREFAADPYIESNRPRSIACMPIVQQSRPAGMLYLENRIAAEIFTPEKIDVLVALATQAAAALENARIYTRLAEATRQQDRAATASSASQSGAARVRPLASMRELVASVVHEVAQPFATVGTAAIAALNWLSAPQPDIVQARSMVEQVVEQSARGRSIVRSLRALVSNATPSFEPFDINESIGQTLQQVENRMREARIELDTHSLKGTLLVYGDRVQLQQVVLNLVLNAMDAMESVSQGKRMLTIRTSHAMTEEVHVAVEDTGPGIAPSLAGRLFSPFATTKKEGLGMGLVICGMIIEAHGGKLTVAAGAESGSVFRFSVPRPSEPVALAEGARAARDT